MFDWLFEGHLSVYLLLAAAAVLFVVLWVRTRKRRWLVAAAIAVALASLYCLLDFAVETDREQVGRKLRAMADGFKAPAKFDAVFNNVSDHFRSPEADMADKAALRSKAQSYVQQYGITEVRISDLHWGEISREKNRAVADFRAKVIGNFGSSLEAVTVHCDAIFDYDAGHGWRMRALGVQGEGPIQSFQIALPEEKP
jgi:hypothetical protein